MQKNDYSISLLKSIKLIQQEFRKLTFQNSDLIEKVTDDFVISLRYNKNTKFFFRVSSPKLISDLRSFFNFDYFPQDEHFIKKTGFNNDISVILENFSIWINLIKEFDGLDLDEDEIQTKFYEDEIYSEFEILDDDAYTAPFEHPRQIFLYNLVTHIEKILKNQPIIDSQSEEILLETEDFKSNIQNRSKNANLAKLSKIFAKIKKKSFELFLVVLEEAKKEIIKKVLTGSLDQLQTYAHHIF